MYELSFFAIVLELMNTLCWYGCKYKKIENFGQISEHIKIFRKKDMKK